MTASNQLLVVLPNWVGDVVMATAALRALRQHFAQSTILHLMRPYVAEVLTGAGLCDEVFYWPSTEAQGVGTTGKLGLLRQLRKRRVDCAVLLTNSFRSALFARLAGARRRVGFNRDGRGWLLTDRLEPKRQGRRFIPVPALDYYNQLARFVGCRDVSDRLVLATSAEDEAAVDERLGPADPSRPLVVLNPGANYGSAKCWPAEHYAQVADDLSARIGARVVASLTPKERSIADALDRACREPIEIFVDPPLGLGPLKALVRRSALLITNDTGPRHFAAAFDVPVITVFGSSDPAWTETRFEKERTVRMELDCQPCMARTCPLGHHRCMKELEPAIVLAHAREVLADRIRSGRAAV